MKALVDFHHSDLLESLHLLLEDRLGIDVYIPVGQEWWDQEYWSFGRWTWGDDRLARQFLNRNNVEIESGHPDRHHRCVTLGQAQRMRWDYALASVPDNYNGYADFAAQHGARFIIQVGNTNQPIDWSLNPLVLNSSEAPITERGVTIHQEFSLRDFRYEPPSSQTIASFVNCMDRIECWWALEEARDRLPSHEFRIHGIDGEHGNLKPTSAVANAMRAAGWGWHDKITGDGFGHVIHNWAAVGRPIIGHASHYRGKLAEPFWQDGVTVIDLDRHSVAEAADIIRNISLLEHRRMAEAMHETFTATVDFAADAEKVRALLQSAS